MLPILNSHWGLQCFIGLVYGDRHLKHNEILKGLDNSAVKKHLRFIIVGGAFTEESLLQRLKKSGISVLNGYGMTECSPVIAVNRISDNTIGSCGLPLRCNKVQIDKHFFSRNGEILVKGKNVALGYYTTGIQGIGIDDDGYFRTGDLGCLKKGKLFIVGKCKNVIILKNGINVIPEELESIVLEKLQCKEVRVFEDAGIICCEIYFGKKLSESEKKQIRALFQDVNKNLRSGHKISKFVFLDEPIQKTSSLKIRRV